MSDLVFERWVGVALLVGALLVFATTAAVAAWHRATQATKPFECGNPDCGCHYRRGLFDTDPSLADGLLRGDR